jgi:hypothetical protein
MSQPESRQMSREIRRWRPQVFVDHHGQVASFFFPPTADPTNHALGLTDYKMWVDRFGRGNAAAFDRFGWEYYVRDIFDFHATGYWDVWPTLQGAIGMTYETDGGGNLAFRRDDETVVTMRDGMARHFTASLATIETAIRFRQERLRDMASFARTSCTPGANAPRAYALDVGDDPVRAAALGENLQYAGIEVQWLKQSFSAKGARAVWSEPASRTAPKEGKGLDREGALPAPKAAAAEQKFANGAFVSRHGAAGQPHRAGADRGGPLGGLRVRAHRAREVRAQRQARAARSARGLRLLRHHVVGAAALLRREGVRAGLGARRRREAGRSPTPTRRTTRPTRSPTRWPWACRSPRASRAWARW